uniref:Uncharacterized protein LOC105122195 n=1 Tax=Rhizophora mucronata TaxID=61149 RepID=A0A2P2L1V7_RHIMU
MKRVGIVWIVEKQIQMGKAKRKHIWVGAILCWVFFMLFTPKIPLSHKHPFFADMRNFLGVPNTLNVITNFPFLVVGVTGFVLSLQGCLFNIRLRGEVWGWALFFGGMVGVAFGSAYYHLKPSDSRVMWDILPFSCGENGAKNRIKLFYWIAAHCCAQHG